MTLRTIRIMTTSNNSITDSSNTNNNVTESEPEVQNLIITIRLPMRQLNQGRKLLATAEPQLGLQRAQPKKAAQ